MKGCNSSLNRGTSQLKRTPLSRGIKGLKRGGKLRVVGVSDTSDKKNEIQRLVRLIVTTRDQGCILRKFRCGVTADVVEEEVVSETVIQADHLITRANSATYADTRLIVCLCKGCHGWKHWNEKEYDRLVKSILSKERVELWEKCEMARHSHQTKKMDWGLEIVALKQELKKLTIKK